MEKISLEAQKTYENPSCIARPKMALDTGATYTMIPWDIAEVLGYDPGASKDRVSLITASGVEKAPLIKK